MYQESNNNKYKKINIQRLESRQQLTPIIQATEKNLIQSLDRQSSCQSKPVLCYKDTGLSSKRLIEKNSKFSVSHFFNAFAYAYAKHGDIVLIPDQIWIMISFYLSKYIDENAEKLRKKLVKHQGIKKLTVKQFANSVQQSLMMEKNWDVFFDEIIGSIKKQTVEGVVQAFQCNFSTTNKTYKVISTSIIMNSMKKFFKYQRSIGFLCGINNVYMAGTREDWAKMIPKLENLIQFDVDGDIKRYVSHMKIILQNFLDTFDEKPNVEWWNTIMTTPQKRSVYFSQQLEVEGWILNFFGRYKRSVLTGFPEMSINVPIKLINEWTKQQKELELKSDFVSVSKLNDCTYKPDVGLAIFEINSKPIVR